jgi:hypothetical protein
MQKFTVSFDFLMRAVIGVTCALRNKDQPIYRAAACSMARKLVPTIFAM